MSGNINVHRTGNNPAENLFDDEYALRGEYRPYVEPPDWRVVLARYLGAAGVVLLLWLSYGVWKSFYCWQPDNLAGCRTVNALEPVAIGLAALGSALGVAWRFGLMTHVEYRIRQARAIRDATVKGHFGHPIRLDRALTAEEFALYRLAAETKVRTAPYEQLPSVDTFSPSYSSAPPALPAPSSPGVVPVPAREWLEWVNSEPHVLLAGSTGSGKTTTAKHIIAPRLAAGEHIFVIDPHSSEWYDLPSVGGGEDWQTVRQALAAVIAEYRGRLAERDRYRRETGKELSARDFARLTVLVDEALIVRLKNDRRERGRESLWSGFADVLGSGARKVNISLVMLTQSALVKDLNISTALRENFTVLALDHNAATELVDAEERVRANREPYYEALAGLAYPAVVARRGRVYLADRTGLDRAPDVGSVAHLAWPGWDYERDEPVARATIDARTDGRTDGDAALKALEALFSDGRTDGRGDAPELDTATRRNGYEAPVDREAARVAVVRRLKAAGRNREEIRGALAANGLGGLSNDEYGELLRRCGLED